MPDLGPHAVFIWAAYAVTLIVVSGLTSIIVLDDRRQRRMLAELERRGVKRRSQPKSPPPQKLGRPARKKAS